MGLLHLGEGLCLAGIGATRNVPRPGSGMILSGGRENRRDSLNWDYYFREIVLGRKSPVDLQ